MPEVISLSTIYYKKLVILFVLITYTFVFMYSCLCIHLSLYLSDEEEVRMHQGKINKTRACEGEIKKVRVEERWEGCKLGV